MKLDARQPNVTYWLLLILRRHSIFCFRISLHVPLEKGSEECLSKESEMAVLSTIILAFSHLLSLPG